MAAQRVRRDVARLLVGRADALHVLRPQRRDDGVSQQVGAARARRAARTWRRHYPGCDIQVVDNILDLKYFKTLLPELAERKLNVSLFYETKSNLKKEQVRLLRDAGVLTIQPGIESFSDKVLKQMKKGVSGLQNIQLLKWCKEIGVHADLVPADRIPAANHRRTTSRWRTCRRASAICRSRLASTSIRLDRFSPNFNEAGQLGFTKLRPLPFYEFLYDLPEPARYNLAYYFAYDYKVPQDVARYADPLVKQRARVEDHLEAHGAGVGRSRRSPVRVRHQAARQGAGVGAEPARIVSCILTCDAITDASALDASSAERLQNPRA